MSDLTFPRFRQLDVQWNDPEPPCTSLPPPPTDQSQQGGYVSHNNVCIYQIFDAYPWLRALYPFEMEQRMDVSMFVDFARDNQWIAWTAVCFYLVYVFWSNYKNKNTNTRPTRHSIWMNQFLPLWNLSLSLISFIGACRLIPEVWFQISYRTLSYSDLLLRDGEELGGQGASGFWLMVFIYLKYLELFDTVFIVCRQRQVPFLHWYHHATVLLFCWRLYADRPAIGIVFAAMNFTVHAVMYFYYFLTAMGIRPRWVIFVTGLQIAQMIGGLFISTTVLHLYITHPLMPHAQQDRLSGLSSYGAIMYGSYLCLFVALFLRRYNILASSSSSFKQKRK